MYISALRDFNIHGRINSTYHCIEKIILKNGNRSVDGEQKKTRKPVSYFSTSLLIFATSIYRVDSSIPAGFLNVKGSRALLDRVQSQSRSRFDYAGKLLKRLNLEASA